MPKKGKQAGTEITHTYEVKEMGVLMGERAIFLFDSFIQEKLGRGSRLDVQFVSREKDKTTKVGCPFCKKGLLKLDGVVPRYSGGPGSTPMIMHHVGNRYEYSCSSAGCGARFSGTYTWMYID